MMTAIELQSLGMLGNAPSALSLQTIGHLDIAPVIVVPPPVPTPPAPPRPSGGGYGRPRVFPPLPRQPEHHPPLRVEVNAHDAIRASVHVALDLHNADLYDLLAAFVGEELEHMRAETSVPSTDRDPF